KDQVGKAQSPHAFASIGHEMSRSARVINASFLAFILGISVLFLVIMSSLPRIDGHHPIAGIQLKTTITRNDLGIPRIAAQTAHDSYFALGWVHAQDRMWQMEIQRRLGAGRLAELVGEPALASDRYMRTLGLYRAAETSLAALSEPTRAALQSYADGVNAWIMTNSHRLPPEFTILGTRPEPWVPADSMVWQKTMALTLTNNWQDDILRAQLAKTLDPRRLQELFPSYPADAPTTLSTEGGRALLDAIPEAGRPRQASNIWVVAGSRTQSGKPLLANDPHLSFRAPVLWYLAELKGPNIELSGATVPGIPFHLIGHNSRIAWGFTATQADTVDLFVEKTVGDKAYRTPDGTKPFVTRTEIIRVKGAADVTLTLRETRHGPVISDLIGKDVAGDGEVVALSATALSTSDTSLQALHRLNQAGDWQSFQAATKDVQAPTLNIGYGDTAGNIGFVTVGRIPIRKSGNGTLPQRGWTGEGDWTGWIPFAKLPQSLNPKSGILVNANNKVVGDKYPYLISANWPEGYRAARIRDLLGDRRGLGVDDMVSIQGDAVSLQAIELKDLLVGMEYKAPKAREAAHLIAEWDGKADRNRAEPLIFAAWINRLNRAILADELKDRFVAFEQIRPQILVDVLTRRRHWCDDVATPEAESCEDLIERSLDQALSDLESKWGKDMGKWRWGTAHPARFEHPILSKVPVLGRMANLEVPMDGDDFTISRASYRTDQTGANFPQVHGAGLRAVFDLADLSKSRFVIATGQSGNPLSRHYDDMLSNWAANRPMTLERKQRQSVLVLDRSR
ncbi:MAG: penicillin acylase family protein, partial [Magnetospirillum sp.]|nr:penicillin acylase family protein [Magnetospirillum sp.]